MKDNLGASPKRIQRMRTKGWKMPPNTVSVTRPGRWGNPYKVDDCDSAEQAIEFYKLDHECLFNGFPSPCVGCQDFLDEVRRELGGKSLACWCKIGQLCHADILLEIAND